MGYSKIDYETQLKSNLNLLSNLKYFKKSL